jgi:hypothetical protein
MSFVSEKRPLYTRGRHPGTRGSLRNGFLLRIFEESLRVSLRGCIIEDAACSFQRIDRQFAHADAMTVVTSFPKLDDLDAPLPRLHE